ncbi:MAG: class I SAM-dependent methyltransferase [Candidatus Nanoarchaeia archaeon]
MEVEDHYNETFREDYAIVRKDFLERVNLVMRLVGKEKYVLDVGCFNGFISQKIQEKGNKVIGIEFSKEAVKLTKAKGVECIQHNIEKKKLPFKDKTFDIVFLGEVIEHIFDTDKLLQESCRVLKDEGELVLTTPNVAALNRRIKLLIGVNPSLDIGVKNEEGKLNPGHIRYFTKKSLEIILRRNGFIPTVWRGDTIILKFLRFPRLAKRFPTFAWCLIVKAKKVKAI